MKSEVNPDTLTVREKIDVLKGAIARGRAVRAGMAVAVPNEQFINPVTALDMVIDIVDDLAVEVQLVRERNRKGSMLVGQERGVAGMETDEPGSGGSS